MSHEIATLQQYYIVDLMIPEKVVNQVAIVPSSWMISDPQYKFKTCFYPKKNAEKKVKKNAIPNHQSWWYYYCTFRGAYDTYEDARSHLSKAAQQSDLNTTDAEDVGRGKRTKKPTKRFTPTPSTCGEDSDCSSNGVNDSEHSQLQSVLPLIPRPTSLAGNSYSSQETNLFQQHSSASTDNELSTSSAHSSSSIQVVRDRSVLPSANLNENNHSYMDTESQCSSSINTGSASSSLSSYNSYQNVHNQIAIIQPPLHLGENGPSSSDTNLKSSSSINSIQSLSHSSKQRQTSVQKDSLRGVLQEVQQPSNAIVQLLLREIVKGNETCNALMAKLVAIEDKLDVLQIARPAVYGAPENIISPMIATPITSLENFKAYEEFVTESADHFYELVRIVRVIGGTTLSDGIKRAWSRILSVEVRAVCNWEGKKRGEHEKHGLKAMKVTEAVFRAFQGSNQFKKHSLKELECETANVMRGAPEAMRKKNRKRAAEMALYALQQPPPQPPISPDGVDN